MSIAAVKTLLRHNQFVRGVTILAGGTIAGQAVAVLVAPFLTRLYTPEDFGLFAVYTSLLMFIAAIATLRYHLAIPLEEEDADAAHVAVLSIMLVLGFTLLSVLMVFLVGESLARLFSAPLLVDYLWLLPVGVVLMGLYQVFYYWNIRSKAFPVIARTKFIQAAGAAGLQLGGSAMGPLALLLGQVAGQVLGVGSLARLTLRRSKNTFRQVHVAGLARVGRRYRRFPIYSSWGGVANDFGLHAPPIFLAASFGTATAGIYALTHRVGAIPMSLIGHAIASVLLANATEVHRQGNLLALVRRVHQNLAAVAAGPAMALIVAGPDLFAVAFGERWREAGEFARWMTPWFYFQFTSSPLSSVFMVLEMQAQYAAFQLCLALAVLVGLSIGAYLNEPVAAVASLSALAGACYLLVGATLFRQLGAGWAYVLTPVYRELSLGTFLASPLFVAVLLEGDRFAVLAALVGSMILICIRYRRLLRSWTMNGD